MNSVRITFIATVLGLAALAQFAQSVPATINYQGRLTDNTPAQAPLNATVGMQFEIWDLPSGGTPADRLWQEPVSGSSSVVVTNGIFNVLLGASAGGSSVPLPASVFSGGTARYLQIISNGETLTPRQTISAAGYVNQAQNAALAASATSAADSAQLGGVAAASWQRALGGTGACGANSFLLAIAQNGGFICANPQTTLTAPLALSGNLGTPVISGTNSFATGVYGENSSTNVSVYGVLGRISSTTPGSSSTGVRGENFGTGAAGYGVWGSHAGGGYGIVGTSVSGRGVYGSSSATSGLSYGIYGVSSSATSQSAGVYGINTSSSGVTVGVYGDASASPSGTGIVGRGDATGAFIEATAASGATTGVLGQNDSTSGASIGVKGTVNSPAGWAVDGESSATTGTNYGVVGQSRSDAGTGVFGAARSLTIAGGSSTFGVLGDNLATAGVAYGVYGHNTSPGGAAIYGLSSANNGNGLIGEANTGANSFGVWGRSTSGFAGQFSGNVNVNGTLSKTAGSFRIDHPLDPAGKYLYHSFVESPDMMNLYNGNITTDGNGEAVVELPDWFEALNKDFRYQLTVIGEFAQAIVGKKIEKNRFTIRTSRPNIEVSWLVTGVRRDAYADAHRIPVEQKKPVGEQGTYLYPELNGQPKEKGVDWQRMQESAGAAPVPPGETAQAPGH